MPRSTAVIFSFALALLASGTSATAKGARPAGAESKWSELEKSADEAYDAKNYASAEKFFLLAIAEAEQDSHNQWLATSLVDLGVLYQNKGRISEAEKTYEKALPISNEGFGAGSKSSANILFKLADIYRTQKRYKEAENYYHLVLSIGENIFVGDEAKLSRMLTEMADFYADRDSDEQAESLYLRAIKILKASESDNIELMRSLTHLGQFYSDQKRYSEAEPIFAEALTIADQNPAPDNAQKLKLIASYAGTYYDENKFALAEPLYQRALDLSCKLTPEDSEIPKLMMSLADAQDMQGKFAQSESTYKNAIAELEKNKNTRDLITCLRSLQKHFLMQKKTVDAEQIDQKIRDLRAKQSSASVSAGRPR